MLFLAAAPPPHFSVHSLLAVLLVPLWGLLPTSNNDQPRLLLKIIIACANAMYPRGSTSAPWQPHQETL
jgi:hypothetical protein